MNIWMDTRWTHTSSKNFWPLAIKCCFKKRIKDLVKDVDVSMENEDDHLCMSYAQICRF